MEINRQKFLMLTAIATAGCKVVKNNDVPTAALERVMNVGPVSDYATDSVHDRFLYQGFFVVRRGETLFAVSAICTHRKCKLATDANGSFLCPCHGLTFDPGGAG